MSTLWTADAMRDAMGARAAGKLPREITGISIDSRTVEAGDAFFALTDARDGHDFVEAALKAGAGLAVVAADKLAQLPKDAPLLIVDDVLDGLRALAAASRARSQAKIIGVTGSVGKTSTKEALRLALSREGVIHASAASYNNHWGVPLSLARCPADARFAIFEMGMNHAGEIEPLSKLVRPHVAIITTVEPVHIEHFKSVAHIADAKAEIFAGLEPGGAAVINRDNEHFARLKKHAEENKVGRIVSFGEHKSADVRLVDYALQEKGSTVRANVFGTDVAYKLGAPGKHLVLNSLAVMAAVSLAGADLALAALALSELQPAPGRGTRIKLRLPDGEALLIDESYNANVASMRAALALLGQAKRGARGRRIAVLGDMLELGDKSAAMHRDLCESVVDNQVDLVFCCGPAMHNLWQALPSERRGGYAEDAPSLEPVVIDSVRDGDVLMIKGSFGSRMGPIVKTLQKTFSSAAMPAQG